MRAVSQQQFLQLESYALKGDLGMPGDWSQTYADTELQLFLTLFDFIPTSCFLQIYTEATVPHRPLYVALLLVLPLVTGKFGFSG